MLDEMERSIHDALCVVKRVLESKSVVPGGGCVEASLSIYLENLATSLVQYSYHHTIRDYLHTTAMADDFAMSCWLFIIAHLLAMYWLY